jgi:hypothetical protein
MRPFCFSGAHRSDRHWDGAMVFNEAENAIFSEVYPVLGYAGVLARLPHLSENRIRDRARQLGLRCRHHIQQKPRVGRDPSPQTIRDRCAEIRAGWDDFQECRALGLSENGTNQPPRPMKIYRMCLPNS